MEPVAMTDSRIDHPGSSWVVSLKRIHSLSGDGEPPGSVSIMVRVPSSMSMTTRTQRCHHSLGDNLIGKSCQFLFDPGDERSLPLTHPQDIAVAERNRLLVRDCLPALLGVTLRRVTRPLVGWANWIGVVCEDLERQRSFYRDLLGFTVLVERDDWMWFDAGWPNLLELLSVDPSQPQYDRPRFQTGFTVGDIRTAREELLRRGVEPVSDIDGGPEAAGYWCYFRDPEGHLFEISQRLGPPWPGASGEVSSKQIVGWPVWIGMVVDDVQSERAFYREVLGLPELQASERGVAFDLGWPHLLEIESLSEPYEKTGFHVSFGVGDVDAAGEELLRRGAEALSEVTGGPESGGFWRYFKDAEGNVFGVSQRLGPPWPTG